MTCAPLTCALASWRVLCLSWSAVAIAPPKPRTKDHWLAIPITPGICDRRNGVSCRAPKKTGRRQSTVRTSWNALHFPTEVPASRPSLGNGGHMHRKTTHFGCNDRRRAPTIRVRLNRHHTADTRYQILCARAFSPDSRFCTIGWLCAVTRGTEHEGRSGCAVRSS